MSHEAPNPVEVTGEQATSAFLQRVGGSMLELRTKLSRIGAVGLLSAGGIVAAGAEQIAFPEAASASIAYNNLGYPWYNAPCEFGSAGGSSCTNPNNAYDSYDWGEYVKTVFHPYRSGYEYRNCTDYVQWREAQVGVTVPGTWGNGGQWYDNAPQSERSSTPAAWDAAVEPGNPGHVAFVESVNSGGTITVSEYNEDGKGDGDTRTGTAASMGFTEFVDFGVHPSGSGGGGSQPAAQQIAYVDTAGDVMFKSGAVNAPFTEIWDASVDPAANVELSPNRIAILDTSGNLFVNQLPIANDWTEESSGVAPGNYQITDDNVSVLLGNALYVKRGSGEAALGSGNGFSGPSVTGAVSFKESQNDNTAVELTNGNVYVAWGGYGASWDGVASNVSSYDIGNNSIAGVFGGQLNVMVGPPGPTSSWQDVLSGAESVQLSAGGNIGAVDTAGSFDVAWGGPGSLWVAPEASNYVQAEASDNQVGVVYSTGELDVKEGSASGSWTKVADNAVEFAIS